MRTIHSKSSLPVFLGQVDCDEVMQCCIMLYLPRYAACTEQAGSLAKKLLPNKMTPSSMAQSEADGVACVTVKVT